MHGESEVEESLQEDLLLNKGEVALLGFGFGFGIRFDFGVGIGFGFGFKICFDFGFGFAVIPKCVCRLE